MSIKHGKCRFCDTQLEQSFCDLGMSPFSNSYLSHEHLRKHESFFPLHAYVCSKCFLVQLEEFQSPAEIFSDYAYFSSYSDTWLSHAKKYCNSMISLLKLNSSSQVIEIASNDGYLLQYFKESNIPILGIEPAQNVARVAINAGIPTLTKFFGVKTAEELSDQGNKADLLIGNNVLAHVPDINDFVKGLKIALKSSGTITMEFPHLLQLMQKNQFDTIYHEHFSYLSLLSVEKIFAKHGLVVFDVEELLTHGGSLRIFACHANHSHEISERLRKLKAREIAFGLDQLETYKKFSEQVNRTKWSLLDFLIKVKTDNRVIVGYGAPAKGNTLLNFCGIRTDFLPFTVDKSPHKQDRFLPGTRVPIKSTDWIRLTKPDYLLILPWNLKDEIMDQMSYIREWGGKFVVPIPQIEVLP